jgi:biotin synthase
MVHIIQRIREETDKEVSTLVTPTVFGRAEMEAVRDAGAENMTVAVDCSTEELFDRMRGKAAKGPHKWDRYVEGIRTAVDVMGPGSNAVGVHLIIGLGESEEEAIRFVQDCYDMGARVHLFSFYPEAGSPMEGVDQPPMEAYRHVQIARHLFDTGQGRYETMTFEAGRLVDFGVPEAVIDAILEDGLAFMTTGCPGCNRPFANETPSQAAEGLLRNYPFTPTEEDTALIRQQL